MANSTSNLRLMAAATEKREVVFNSMVDAASPATFGGRDELGCSGLTWAYLGGNWFNAGTVGQLANGTLALTGSTTNYIQFDPSTGSIESNTTAFTTGKIPLYSVVTGTSTVTSWTDVRLGPPVKPRVAVSMASDANKTLTYQEAAADIIDITSAVSLGATRDIILPLQTKMWVVFNGTTGAQSLRFIGASGTGITVANAKRAILYADGTNIVRVTADNP
jgi:hypothetical protein